MPKTPSNADAEKNQLQTPQDVLYSHPFEDDTIDLYELWITLWNKRWIVISVTILAALGSVVFALLQTPIYKAKVFILPPKAEDVQSLNLREHGRQKEWSYNLESEGVFAIFKKNLSSRNIQKKFIKEYGLMKILDSNHTPGMRDEDIYDAFSLMLQIEDNSISIELYDPEVAAQWANNYVKYVDIETIRQLVGNVRKSNLNRIRDIEYTIGSKRQMAKQRRQDKILVYVEAKNIALILGVKDRVDTTNVVQYNQLNTSTGNNPLYYRGSRALMAEINILTNRNTDDPFIHGLRDLQEELALLNSIMINVKEMHAVTIDQAAYPPKTRIKPNRKKIVLVGTLAGSFFGIFMIFFISFVQKKKEVYSKKLS